MNRTHLLAVLLLAFARPPAPRGHGAIGDRSGRQNLFDATAMTALAAATLIPEGRLIVVTDGTEGITHRAWDHADFVTMIAKGDSVLVERMWDPVVSIDGPIATFRARYDFYRDGDYSHCGVDLFTLVKAAAGWRISGGTFTREVRQCGQSAAGADRRHARNAHRPRDRGIHRRVHGCSADRGRPLR